MIGKSEKELLEAKAKIVKIKKLREKEEKERQENDKGK